MSEQANVVSIDALKTFRHAMSEFRDIAVMSLSGAQSDVQRTMLWLQHDQTSHWKNQLRKRKIKLAMAESELFRAQATSSDQRVSATMERRAVERTKQAVEECITKLANIKRWTRLLDREFLLYKGKCSQLASAAEGEIPKAVAKMEKMIQALENYVRLRMSPEEMRNELAEELLKPDKSDDEDAMDEEFDE